MPEKTRSRVMIAPRNMMESRIAIKPERNAEKCAASGDCAVNCPANALFLEPEFHISDECIACDSFPPI